MVSFHQNTQRFAIGTKDKLIIIYDLRTAAKWRILEGHEKPITSLDFDKTGKFIASYSNLDLSIRV
jgi:WD40 repeat protein